MVNSLCFKDIFYLINASRPSIMETACTPGGDAFYIVFPRPFSEKTSHAIAQCSGVPLLSTCHRSVQWCAPAQHMP